MAVAHSEAWIARIRGIYGPRLRTVRVRPSPRLAGLSPSCAAYELYLPCHLTSSGDLEKTEENIVTIQELAKEAYGHFETTDSGIVRIKGDAPEWITDLAREAHRNEWGASGGSFPHMLPDDYRFRVIREALEAIASSNDDGSTDDIRAEFADDVDVYNSDLLAWLASNAGRASYCDEAEETCGSDFLEGSGIIARIARGQYMEREEIFGLVLGELEKLAASGVRA